jgi:transcriptional regulator with XRE-family HTH domain
MSRGQLAVAASISMSALISYEQGNSVPSDDRAHALAAALGVSLNDLFRELEGANAA